MGGGLRSRNMNNGKGSNKSNLGFNNPGNNLKDFSNRKGKSKDLRFRNHNTISLKENLEVGSIEVKKAGRIEARGDRTIRSNDIWQSLLLVEHLHGKRREMAIL
jgi:hypothetical protein